MCYSYACCKKPGLSSLSILLSVRFITTTCSPVFLLSCRQRQTHFRTRRAMAEYKQKQQQCVSFRHLGGWVNAPPALDVVFWSRNLLPAASPPQSPCPSYTFVLPGHPLPGQMWLLPTSMGSPSSLFSLTSTLRLLCLSATSLVPKGVRRKP